MSDILLTRIYHWGCERGINVKESRLVKVLILCHFLLNFFKRVFTRRYRKLENWQISRKFELFFFGKPIKAELATLYFYYNSVGANFNKTISAFLCFDSRTRYENVKSISYKIWKVYLIKSKAPVSSRNWFYIFLAALQFQPKCIFLAQTYLNKEKIYYVKTYSSLKYIYNLTSPRFSSAFQSKPVMILPILCSLAFFSRVHFPENLTRHATFYSLFPCLRLSRIYWEPKRK